jgi:hypothetical protein
MLFKQSVFRFFIFCSCISSAFYGSAQFCLNGGPSSTDDSNVKSVLLTGVLGSINYLGCPGILGIEDLTTSQQVGLGIGNTYTAYIDFGTCGGNYSSVAEAWIDFNNNQQFETTESIGTWQGMPPSATQDFTFQVPFGALNGPVRMRVMMEEGGSLPLDPCASFDWGSVVDFTVNLQNGISCIGYFGNAPSDAIEINNYPYVDTNSTVVCYSSYSYVYSSPDVFYLAVLDPSKDSLQATLCGSDFDTYLSVQNMAGDVIYYNDDYTSCAPSSQVIFPTAGLDSVYIIVEGWNNLAGSYILNINNDYSNSNTSTSQISQDLRGLRVFPNPTNSALYIEGVVPKSSAIYSINGQYLKGFEDQSTIELGFLPKGIYVLEIACSGALYRKKIIKQ